MLNQKQLQELFELPPEDRYHKLITYHHEYAKPLTDTTKMKDIMTCRLHIYVILNHVNKRIYIGMHSVKKKERFCSYRGSSKYLARSIGVHDVSNFSKSILYEHDDIEHVYDIERQLITQDFIALGNKYTYNRHVGGAHFAGHKDAKILIHKETKEKSRIPNIDVPSYLATGDYDTYSPTKGKTFIVNIHTGKHFYAKKSKAKEYFDTGDYEIYNPCKGVKKSDDVRRNVSIGTKKALAPQEVRDKIGLANKNRSIESRRKYAASMKAVWATNKNNATTRLSNSVKEYFKDPENRKKTAEATKAGMQSEEVRKKCAKACKGKHTYHKGNVNKMLTDDEVEKHIADGWKLGRHRCAGSKSWYNNGVDESIVHDSELSKYLDSGWKRGRLERTHVKLENKRKKILPNQINEYIANGWTLV